MEWLSRTALLLGDEAVRLLSQKHVLVVGVGGVGAYAAEMIVRAGIGRITLVDADTVQPSNINRQLIATHHTIGREKVGLMAERLKAINPELYVDARFEFLDPPAIDRLLSEGEFDFIVDAIDTITPKVHLIGCALQQKRAIVSSMGAGGRIDPSAIELSVLSQTYNCGLAKAVRTRLKKEGIGGKLPVVFSTETVDRQTVIPTEGERNKKSTVGTISYLPAIFGCYLASYVLRQLIQKNKLENNTVLKNEKRV